MIYTTKKYSSLEDFIYQNNNKARDFHYSLPMQTCKAVSQSYTINNTCFYCNFCAFGNLANIYNQKIETEVLPKYNSNSFFQDYPIKVPNARFHGGNINNKNIETFTAIEETKRIQLWATCILSNCTPNNVDSAIEIPAPANNCDRDGRIDIGIKENNSFLFIETKTTLSDAMSDERFVEQHAKYTPAIENNINTSIERFSLCILIGGKETDLFPPSNEYCTGNIGNLTKRFYKLISINDKRIPFVSATAIWMLSVYYLEHPNFSINEFLIDLFSEENCYGLVSAGKICYDTSTNSFSIEKIQLQ